MIINLLAPPRSLSTALMYSFAQRADMQVVDEPFYAYYLQQTGVSHPGREETLAAMKTDYAQIVKNLVSRQDKETHLFIKGMAHHMLHPEVSFMYPWQNLFLIRHPRQSIASFAQVIAQPTMRDIGLKRQHELWEELQAQAPTPPVVVDSGEVLKDPEGVIFRLCEALGIPFNPAMLSWEAGARPEDGPWARYWYKNVHQSTGFQKKPSSERPFPSSCLDLLEEALPYYEAMYQHSIQAP